MPFIIKYPGVTKPKSVNTDIISNIDFAPTLLDLANIKSKTKMQGKSFASMLAGKTPKDWRQSMYYHYYEYPFWHHVQPHYGIRTQRYTLAHFYYNIDKWELYDLQKDPEQLHNVIDDSIYADVIRSLKLQLKQLQKEYDDNKTLEEYRKISDTDFGSIEKDIDVKKILKK
jgi:arylsulfatase A-like enzyme